MAIGPFAVRSTKVKDTPLGVWNGGYRWQIMLIDNASAPFAGCPLGRDVTEESAMLDFVRRVNNENGKFEKIDVGDIYIEERVDRSHY